MSYLYIDPALRHGGVLRDPRLPQFTERHHFRLPPVQLADLGGIERRIDDGETLGVIFGLASGLPNKRVLALARYALRRRKSAFLYWPTENAIEVLDRERIGSFWRHRVAYIIGMRLLAWRQWRAQRAVAVAADTAGLGPAISLAQLDQAVKSIAADFATANIDLFGGIDELRRLADSIASHKEALKQVAEDAPAISTVAAQLVTRMDGSEIAFTRIGTKLAELSTTFDQLLKPAPPPAPHHILLVTEEYRKALSAFAGTTLPVSFRGVTTAPSVANKMPGRGVYVRADYWSQLSSGGSYGHTCYLAKELAKLSDDFVCLFGSRFPLMDDLGVAQEVVRPPYSTASCTDLLKANEYYYQAMRERFGQLQPAYIYERMVLGNFAAARLSRELKIPYIIEYNGSELSMGRSFGAGPTEHEDLFMEAERVAFEQATAITAVSIHVRDDIVRRGIDPRKIVVNPNGVDCSEYAPATPEEKRELRTALGFSPEDRVVGFIGTFGGWHGIDVLAAALPKICQRAPQVRFLLIGDGKLKATVIEAIREHKLEPHVVDVGRTDQRVGARYLRAADIYVSPHSSHMRGSRFFGSPTKLFEYMALGGGIVASDLEQIGLVLSPALRPADFASAAPVVERQRAVLCRPGDVEDFVDGVVALVEHPELAAALGRNARAAAQAHFTWERHVARIWDHVFGLHCEPAWLESAKTG
jgi:glycosyltransferase involved in cell wall biosynthesis